MKKAIFALAALFAISLPLMLSAETIVVSSDVPDVGTAVMVAQDGDTVSVPGEIAQLTFNIDGKEVVIGINAMPPEGAEPDSMIYGPNNPFPQCPLE